MAELGIRFTILAPHQAKQVRLIGQERWVDVSGGTIDPTLAYRDQSALGPQDRGVFLRRPHLPGRGLRGSAQPGRRPGPTPGRGLFRRAPVAAIGAYRHGRRNLRPSPSLRRHGPDLRPALHRVENNLASLTNYGEYLEKHPPAHEVEIFENTSWSCSHGVERWWRDCGCNSGGTSRLEPGLAHPSARGPGLAPGHVWRHFSKRRPGNISKTPGRPGTTISRSSWTAPRRTWIAF